MACSAVDPVGCVTSIAGGAVQSVADSTFSAIAHDFSGAADSVVTWLWAQLSTATAVTLSGHGFDADLSITAAIAATVGAGLFVIQVIAAVLRREPGGLARAGRGLLVAFVAGAASVTVVNALLAATDSLSNGVVAVATGGTISQMGTRLLSATALTTITNPAVTILVSLVIIVSVVIVWATLMVRKLLIIIAAVFAPVAFAGSLADITTAWVRRWIETMIALIASKLILVIIFAVGLGVLETGAGTTPTDGSGGGTQTATQTVTGALILLMAGFAPWMAIKLVHFAGDSFHTIHGQAASVGAAAATAAAAPRKLAANAKRLPASSRGFAAKPSTAATGGRSSPPAALGAAKAAGGPTAAAAVVAAAPIAARTAAASAAAYIDDTVRPPARPADAGGGNGRPPGPVPMRTDRTTAPTGSGRSSQPGGDS